MFQYLRNFLDDHLGKFSYQQKLNFDRQPIETVQNLFLLLAALLEKIRAEILCTTVMKDVKKSISGIIVILTK